MATASVNFEVRVPSFVPADMRSKFLDAGLKVVEKIDPEGKRFAWKDFDNPPASVEEFAGWLNDKVIPDLKGDYQAQSANLFGSSSAGTLSDDPDLGAYCYFPTTVICYGFALLVERDQGNPDLLKQVMVAVDGFRPTALCLQVRIQLDQ